MMKPSSIFLLSLAFLIASTPWLAVPAYAQIDRYTVEPESGADTQQAEPLPGRPPGQQAGNRAGGAERLERMQKRLDLSDEQVSQLREIRQRGGSREEIRAVFTDEQWARMQERRRQANAKKTKDNPGRYFTLPPSQAEANTDADSPDSG